MHLSWNEIKARANVFAKENENAHYEKGETQTFYNDFFNVFGLDRKRVATYERSVAKIGGNKGFIDLFWPGVLIVEQKSKGRDLFKAETQAIDYTQHLSDADMPRYVLVSDFQTFKLIDLKHNTDTAFTLADLPNHVQKFGFMLGRTKRTFKDQDPVNIQAAELVGHLHDGIEASGYTGHRLEKFLVRTVFCLFADDTGIFEPKDTLWDFLENRTAPDGSDMGLKLGQLFEVLNTPEDQRQTTLDEDLQKFPYVNGGLFEEYLPPPAFDGDMRAALLNACRFDWTPISPAIFGSLFQSVMNADERRALGAHYTTEANIMKVIEPLFMDDLRAELASIMARKNKRREHLLAFQEKLASLTFFDPACGSGNFLIIAYREIRLLEIEIIKALNPTGQQELNVDILSKVDVDQFYGIEIDEFPARIAETALWMMDHIMNVQLSAEFGNYYNRIPLKKSPTILNGDALATDWADLLPPEKCSFIMGNPPFIGAKFQTPDQRQAIRDVANLGKSGGTLDFVCGWFIKAGQYAVGDTRIAFVSTNSITQGEQVAQMWPILFDQCKLEIAFAHRTFAWGSEARGKANVHVVIIGFDRRENARAEKRLYSYDTVKGEPEETTHRVLSPYLFDASLLGNPHTVVHSTSSPISEFHKLKTGVQMIDDGILTFTDSEKEQFISMEPQSEIFFKKYVGGDEFINGFYRWILYLRSAEPTLLKKSPMVMKRIAEVKKYRSQSKRPSTLRLAEFPTLLGVDERLSNPYLVIPNTSSERREYVPIGWLPPETVANQKLRILPNATPGEFAILTSSMHMAWMRTVTGRMKSDYMYSVGVVYNTFPLPDGKDVAKLEPYGQAILDARANHPDATLADLYDPDVMPADLRKAHIANDKAVDALYKRGGFKSERERVEHLFMLYERQTAPMLAKPKKRRR